MTGWETFTRFCFEITNPSTGSISRNVIRTGENQSIGAGISLNVVSANLDQSTGSVSTFTDEAYVELIYEGKKVAYSPKMQLGDSLIAPNGQEVKLKSSCYGACWEYSDPAGPYALPGTNTTVTISGACSRVNTSYYCLEATPLPRLIQDCTKCGCPNNTVCNSETKSCVKAEVTASPSATAVTVSQTPIATVLSVTPTPTQPPVAQNTGNEISFYDRVLIALIGTALAVAAVYYFFLRKR
jgi:hypothetical protein